MPASSYKCTRSHVLNFFKKRLNITICQKHVTVAGVDLWNKLPIMYKTVTNDRFFYLKNT